VKKILISALLFISCASSAELLHSSWKEEGDNKVSVDTDTGIEWLKLTETKGMSASDVSIALENELNGWRLPTADAVMTMMNNSIAWYSTTTRKDRATQANDLYHYKDFYPSNGVSQKNYDRIRNAINMYGSTNNGYGFQSSGFYEIEGVYKKASIKITSGGDLTVHGLPAQSYDFTSDTINGISDVGFFLVSDGGLTISSINDPSMNANNANAPINQVSLPATLGLFSLSLVFFCSRRKIH
jgi:hypothetical protein